jgi:hypothetical protein
METREPRPVSVVEDGMTVLAVLDTLVELAFLLAFLLLARAASKTSAASDT